MTMTKSSSIGLSNLLSDVQSLLWGDFELLKVLLYKLHKQLGSFTAIILNEVYITTLCYKRLGDAMHSCEKKCTTSKEFSSLFLSFIDEGVYF